MGNAKLFVRGINKEFIVELLRLAEIAIDSDGDTVDFTLAEKDGIRMDVSISFSYTEINEED